MYGRPGITRLPSPRPVEGGHLRGGRHLLELGDLSGAAAGGADALVRQDPAEGVLRQGPRLPPQLFQHLRGAAALLRLEACEHGIPSLAVPEEAAGEDGGDDDPHAGRRGRRDHRFGGELRDRMVVVVHEQGVELPGRRQPPQQRNCPAGDADEIAHPLLLRRPQPLEGAPRFGYALPAGEVDLVDLRRGQALDAEPPEAALQAAQDRAGAVVEVIGVETDLGRHLHRFARGGQRLPEELLAVAVQGGGVDVVDPQLQGPRHQLAGVLPAPLRVGAADVGSPEADLAHLQSRSAQRPVFHSGFPFPSPSYRPHAPRFAPAHGSAAARVPPAAVSRKTEESREVLPLDQGPLLLAVRLQMGVDDARGAAAPDHAPRAERLGHPGRERPGALEQGRIRGEVV